MAAPSINEHAVIRYDRSQQGARMHDDGAAPADMARPGAPQDNYAGAAVNNGAAPEARRLEVRRPELTGRIARHGAQRPLADPPEAVGRRSAAERLVSGGLHLTECAAWGVLMGTHVIGVGFVPVALAVWAGLRGLQALTDEAPHLTAEGQAGWTQLTCWAGTGTIALMACGISPVTVLDVFFALKFTKWATQGAIQTARMPAPQGPNIKTFGERLVSSVASAAGGAALAVLMGTGVLAVSYGAITLATLLGACALSHLVDKGATRMATDARVTALAVCGTVGITFSILLATGAMATTLLPVFVALFCMLSVGELAVLLALAPRRHEQMRYDPIS